MRVVAAVFSVPAMPAYFGRFISSACRTHLHSGDRSRWRTCPGCDTVSRYGLPVAANRDATYSERALPIPTPCHSGRQTVRCSRQNGRRGCGLLSTAQKAAGRSFSRATKQ